MKNDEKHKGITFGYGLHPVRGSRGGDVSSDKTDKNIACGFVGYSRASAL